MSAPRLWAAGDLAAHEFEEPTFLVDPLIPLGGLVMLHGKRGLGKSQLSLSLASAVVSGTPWLGRWPTLPGPAVIVQVDMTAQLQQLRVRAAHGVLPMDGIYYTFPLTLNLRDMRIRHPALVHGIREIDPVLIIWDTLRKIHRESENSSEAPQYVYTAAKQLFPGSTHFFVHHDKKTNEDPNLRPDPEEAFRGSGDWLDSADTSFQLRGDLPASFPKRLVLRPHKCRSAPEYEKEGITLEMDARTILLAEPFL